MKHSYFTFGFLIFLSACGPAVQPCPEDSGIVPEIVREGPEPTSS